MRQPLSTLFPYTTLFRSGIFKLVLQFACRVQRIDVDHREPGTQCTEQRDRVLQQIGQHDREAVALAELPFIRKDRKSTRLNSSHMSISYAVFCLKKKKQP